VSLPVSRTVYGRAHLRQLPSHSVGCGRISRAAATTRTVATQLSPTHVGSSPYHYLRRQRTLPSTTGSYLSRYTASDPIPTESGSTVLVPASDSSLVDSARIRSLRPGLRSWAGSMQCGGVLVAQGEFHSAEIYHRDGVCWSRTSMRRLSREGCGPTLAARERLLERKVLAAGRPVAYIQQLYFNTSTNKEQSCC
jgi:hypothetical protein